eukprot:807796-Rhodomonas_salina.3
MYALTHVRCVQDLGMGDEAVAMTKMAVELKPSLGAAHNNYGRALEHQDRLEDALTAYKTCVVSSRLRSALARLALAIQSQDCGLRKVGLCFAFQEFGGGWQDLGQRVTEIGG